jgi:hypothetical protein
MASLPRAVQKHQKDIEDLERQLQAPAQTDDGSADGQTGDDQGVDTSNENRDSEVPREEPSGQQAAESREKQPTDTSESDADDDESKWEHKYRRLQGKYDAEVPRLHDEIRNLKGLIQQLQQQAQTQTQPEQGNSQQGQGDQAASQTREKLVTDTDVEAFGDDLIDLQRRVAREVADEFQEQIGSLRQENEQLRQQVNKAQGTSFEARLHQAIPDFQQINSDQRWIEWLDEFDPMIQGPRRSMAEAAYQRGDVDAVKAYVDLFRKTIEQEDTKPAKPQSSVKADRQEELQRQVQPTKSSAPAPTPQSGGRIISAQEFERGMNRATKLMQQGKFDEAAALESEMSTAVAEGRVAAR